MPARARNKKLFTVAEANATLPLVRSIVRDITILAGEMRDRFERMQQLRQAGKAARREQANQLEAELDRNQERMEELETELRDLGVELKDYFIGLIDFRGWMNDHEVYLCWKLDEPEVGHWHELDAGFAGRQKLPPDVDDPIVTHRKEAP
jgi:hypothetical protein